MTRLDLVEEIAPPRFTLGLDPLLRTHGYRDLSRVSPEITATGREMLAVAERLIEPRAFAVRREVERVERDALVLSGGLTFHGSCFWTHLEKASAVACFVVTLGEALDRRAAELSDTGDMLEALFLDTAGSLAVQQTVRRLRGHLAVRARADGLALSPRLGPGYHDWPLTEQAALFSAFPRALPVTLTEACIMVPLKSLSGLFGLIPAALWRRP